MELVVDVASWRALVRFLIGWQEEEGDSGREDGVGSSNRGRLLDKVANSSSAIT